MSGRRSRRIRVLLVEDEAMVAVLLEEMLQELDCDVVGPVGRLGPARISARDEEIDCAILDVNLAGELVFPVAEILEMRGIPFAFSSGYGAGESAAAFHASPVLKKPFSLRAVRGCLRALMPDESAADSGFARD